MFKVLINFTDTDDRVKWLWLVLGYTVHRFIYAFVIVCFGCANPNRPDLGSDHSETSGRQGATATTADTEGKKNQGRGNLSVSGLPQGRSSQSQFQVQISAKGYSQFSYKIGIATEIQCSQAAAYSLPYQTDQIIELDTSSFGDQYVKFCAIGIQADGSWQALSEAKQVVWIQQGVAPEQERIATNTEAGSSDFIDCALEPNYRSEASEVPISLAFQNQGDETLRLHWLDFKGGRVFYGAIDPGFQLQIDSFQTHPWLITDVNNRCLAIFVGRRDQQVTLGVFE